MPLSSQASPVLRAASAPTRIANLRALLHSHIRNPVPYVAFHALRIPARGAGAVDPHDRVIEGSRVFDWLYVGEDGGVGQSLAERRLDLLRHVVPVAADMRLQRGSARRPRAGGLPPPGGTARRSHPCDASKRPRDASEAALAGIQA